MNDFIPQEDGKSLVYISGFRSADFVLNLDSWFTLNGYQVPVTTLEVYKQPEGSYQAYAFNKNGNVVHIKRDGLGLHGNGITYEEFRTVVCKWSKDLSEAQVNAIDKMFPGFGEFYMPRIKQ